MKKALLLIAVLTISFVAKSQGNLQFNQVIRIKHTTLTSGVAGTITVPAGKVWKIESASGGDAWELSVDGQIVYSSSQQVSGTTQSWYVNTVTLPMWLGPGTYQITENTTYTGNITTVLSGIEFNVVP